jgi:hypothetical protein
MSTPALEGVDVVVCTRIRDQHLIVTRVRPASTAPSMIAGHVVKLRSRLALSYDRT